VRAANATLASVKPDARGALRYTVHGITVEERPPHPERCRECLLAVGVRVG
jgi:hypothetical protein